MPLRSDIPYVGQDGALTQAGFQALTGELKALKASIASLQTNVTALQAIEAGNVTNAPGSPPRFFPRAWVNFNGTGTVAIRASGNVASITDNGVGDYTINFTTAMPDANYAVVASSGDVNAPVVFIGDSFTLRTTTAVRLRVCNTSFALTDSAHVSVAVFR